MGKYLITGGTGNIGKYVVEELLKMHKDVKVALRNIQQVKQVLEDRKIEFVTFDFLDATTFSNALEG